MVWWFVVVLVIAVVAASYSVSPKTPEPVPPTLKDIQAPTAEQGRPIPVVFGTYVVQSPNIVWYGDLGYKEIKQKSSGGGK
jgi:hypothetical protein